MTRPSGRFGSAPVTVRVQLSAKIADTWKPSLKEIGLVVAGTNVEVLEDMIVVDGPDIVRVTRPVAGLNVKEGDTILRYTRLGEGSSDLWTGGCWYKDANSEFIVEPDGGGCGGSDCAAKVTKMGKQKWWLRIRLARRTSRMDVEYSAGFVGGRVGVTLPCRRDLGVCGFCAEVRGMQVPRLRALRALRSG